ncbi:MAG TPA: insulinase family protein [Pirellulales bacterium]|jgi:zinc protease|nr:insulinase family protein [Pirellulales bacterium]
MKTTLITFCAVLSFVVFARAESPSRTLRVKTSSSIAAASKAGTVAKPWPHEASDLRPDPSAVWGKLDNGLRYVILPNQQAPGRASLRLYMNVGSRMEAEDQQGMAHFLEHMAFNGTKHFPAGETIEYLQRLGMAFVADTNACTMFDRTVYQLELPRTNEETTDEGLKLFRDFLDGMLLDKKEIERERRVILSEILARDSADYRSLIPQLQFTIPDTLVARRMPAGKIETVRALSPQRFVDFYETWYTPARAVIVAAGKFDANRVERLIRRNFQDAKAHRGEQPDPSIGSVSPATGVTAEMHVEKDLPVVSIVMSAVALHAEAPDSVARQRQEIVRLFANVMLSKRFDKLAAAKDAVIQLGAARHELLYNLADLNSLTAVCQPSQWKAALGVLEQELRRAMEYGFTDAEFDEAKAIFLKIGQAQADQAETRQSSDVAGGIIDSLAENHVVTSPADDLALLKNVLAGLKKEECVRVLRDSWDSRGVRIWVQGNLQVAGDGAEQILAAYRLSRSMAVNPPADEKAGRWAYTNFGPAGQIVKQQVQKDLAITEAVFANNVRVNIKRTPLEKNNVRVLVRFGGGLLELPADKCGLNIFANLTFTGGGLEAHSLTDLNRALAGKNASINFAVGEESFQLSGSCAPAALESELQLCAAYLTAPGYRPETRDQFLLVIDGLYAQTEHTAAGVLFNEACGFLRSADPRFIAPPREVMRKFTLDDLKKWLANPLATGYMEVAIVGDIDPMEALQLAAKTVGALPDRAAVKPAFAKERDIRFPVATKTKEFRFASETPCAISFVCWPTSGGRDIPRDRRIGALAAVLNDRLRLKVRQELGATYTPEVVQYSSDAFPDYGYLAALMTVDPKQMAQIGPLVAKIGADLAAGSIGDDEFDRAMKPVLISLDDLDNGYWCNLLGHCQEHPEFLAAARGRKADYMAISKADLESLAKLYLAADKATIIGLAPTAPVK